MQEDTSQQTPAIFSTSVKTKGKMYFFDVKAAKNGNKYLNITQSWIKDGQGHRGTVIVFKEHLPEFLQAMNEAQEKVVA